MFLCKDLGTREMTVKFCSMNMWNFNGTLRQWLCWSHFDDHRKKWSVPVINWSIKAQWFLLKLCYLAMVLRCICHSMQFTFGLIVVDLFSRHCHSSLYVCYSRSMFIIVLTPYQLWRCLKKSVFLSTFSWKCGSNFKLQDGGQLVAFWNYIKSTWLQLHSCII